MTQMLKCKEEDALDTNSRDSDDVSQYFKSEDQGFPTKRRKTSLVRREISYQDDDEAEILEKEQSTEYSITEGQSLDDGNAGNQPIEGISRISIRIDTRQWL
jgi:hypothetical protein